MIVFDLDGTLVDSEGEIRAALRHAWQAVLPELPYPEDAFRIGPPLLPMVAAATPGLSPERRDAFVRTFRSRYDASDWSSSPPYDGMVDLLAALAARGETVAVATNKRLAPSVGLLARWFPGRFALIACIDGVVPDDGTAPGNKPAMLGWLLRRTGADPASSALVGDTTGDVTAARAAGMRSIAVSWGFEDRSVLAAAGPDVLVHDMAGLRDALGEWAERTA